MVEPVPLLIPFSQLTPQQIPMFIDNIVAHNKDQGLFNIGEYCKGLQYIFTQHPQFTPQVLSVLQKYPYKEIPAILMSCQDEHVNGCIQIMTHWISTTSEIQIAAKALGFLGFKSKGRTIPDVYPYIESWLPRYTRELLMPIKQLMANNALTNHIKDIFLKMDPTYYSQYGDMVLNKKNDIPADHMASILQIYMKHTAQFQGKRSTLCMLLKTILHTIDKAPDVKMVQQLHVFFTMKLHTIFSMYASKEIQVTPEILQALKSANIEQDYVVDPLVNKLFVCDNSLDADELIIAFRIASMGIKQTTGSLLAQNQQRANNPQVPDPVTIELYDWIKTAVEFLLKMSAISSYQQRFGVDYDKEETWLPHILKNGCLRTPMDHPDALTTNWKNCCLQIEQEVVETLLTTFTSIPSYMIASLLPDPELLFRSCKFHSIRIGFIQSLLNNPNLSGPLAIHFFKYFQSTLSILPTLDPIMLKIYMRIAKLTMMTFATTSSQLMTLHYEVITFIRSTSNFFIQLGHECYLQLLIHLFRSIGNSPRDDIYVLLEPCIHDLITIIHTSLSYPLITLLCTEILLTLPCKLQYLVQYLPKLIQPILIALNAPFTHQSSELCVQGLNTLHVCLDHLEEYQLENLIDSHAQALHHVLHLLLECHSTDQVSTECHEIALTVALKLQARIPYCPPIDNYYGQVLISLNADPFKCEYDLQYVLTSVLEELSRYHFTPVDPIPSLSTQLTSLLKYTANLTSDSLNVWAMKWYALAFFGIEPSIGSFTSLSSLQVSSLVDSLQCCSSVALLF